QPCTEEQARLTARPVGHAGMLFERDDWRAAAGLSRRQPLVLAVVLAARGFYAQLLELAIQVGALEAGLFGYPRHAVVFAAQVVLEIDALEFVAGVAQGLVERNAAQQRIAGFGNRRRSGLVEFGHRHGGKRLRTGVEQFGRTHGGDQARRHHGTRQAGSDGLEQHLQRDGLFKEINRAYARGLDGGVDRGVPAHHDDGHVEQALRSPLFKQADPVGVRHPDVEKNQVGPASQPRRARLGGVFREFDRVPFVVENLGQQFAYTYFVVNNQNSGHKASPMFFRHYRPPALSS